MIVVVFFGTEHFMTTLPVLGRERQMCIIVTVLMVYESFIYFYFAWK